MAQNSIYEIFFRGIKEMPNIGTESMAKLTPHLMRLHESERLYDLARDKGPAARQELSQAITDLFASTDLSVREQEMVADIMITMLRQAELDLRTAIAERVATLEKAPLRVVLYLSNDDIDVARPVLSNSPVLEDMDLMYLIQTQKSAYWQAIATRAGLPGTVVRALVDTRDAPTATTLVKNDKVEIPKDCFTTLTEMAAGTRDLCAPLLQRADLPKELVAKLYTYASQKIENALVREAGPMPAAIQETIADITLEMVDAANNSYTPSDLMLQAARSLHAKNQLNVDTMMKALKLGQIASFMAQLSAYADIPVARVKEFMLEPMGDTLAAICRVNRIDKKVFLKMFLLTQRYRSGDRMVDPHNLNEAMGKYDQLTPEKCQFLINRHRGSVN